MWLREFNKGQIEINMFTIGEFKDIVQTVTGVGAVLVAFSGLKTWKRQLKGGVEYELARRLLKSSYQMREALKAVRNPIMFPDEMPFPPTEQAAKMAPDDIRYYGLAKGYQTRWEKVVEVQMRMDTDFLEAEALWGKAVYDWFSKLTVLRHELKDVVYLHVRSIDPKNDLSIEYDRLKREKRDILYDLSTSIPDDYTSDVHNAISIIERKIEPYLVRDLPRQAFFHKLEKLKKR